LALGVKTGVFFSAFYFAKDILFFPQGFLGLSEGRLFRPEEKPRNLRGKNKYLRRNKNAEKITPVSYSVGQIVLKPPKKGKKPFGFCYRRTWTYFQFFYFFSVFLSKTRDKDFFTKREKPRFIHRKTVKKNNGFLPCGGL